MSNVSLATRFEDYLRRDDFPCVGAKAALSQGAIEVIEAPDISSPVSDLDIYKALSEFGDHLDLTAPVVQSFAIVFSGPDSISEEQFETFMWNRLQSLHNIDAAAGETWRSDVDADPESAHFSLCLAGRPYFVVGLHPSASRPARRFEAPALVFNSHEQFEKLRADGRFYQMQKIIRRNEIKLNGSVNPMLADFGEDREAAQYSGRLVDKHWNCPFTKKEPLHDASHPAANRYSIPLGQGRRVDRDRP
ncbi:MAG: hypothetical protein CME88_04095 [Hirschia sp.]|nr:hypothetical protein [Hirschia sp.]MBF17540.1 hypothetical protein [Hirschia sp.]|tara:strand:+ start:98 stop:841 length:744 start_codon:yes stop_codon:yes gene_type:complete